MERSFTSFKIRLWRSFSSMGTPSNFVVIEYERD
jgi:hypothetical protein